MSSLCFSPGGGGGEGGRRRGCTRGGRVYESEQTSVMLTCCWSFSPAPLVGGRLWSCRRKQLTARALKKTGEEEARGGELLKHTRFLYCKYSQAPRCIASWGPRLCSPSATWNESKHPQPTGWPCVKKSPPAMHQVSVPSAGEGELFLSWKPWITWVLFLSTGDSHYVLSVSFESV